MDAIPTGFCVCRADRGLVRYNRRAVELWGRTPPLGDPNDQHGSSFRRYSAAGEPLPFDATPVALALRSGEPVVGAELVIERPDGSRVPVLMNVTPLRDQTGRVEGAVCSFQELTEHKRAEERCAPAKRSSQSVINRTPFMLVRCSRDLRYRFISEAYAHMIGRAATRFSAKPLRRCSARSGFNTLRPYIDEVLRGEPWISNASSTFRRSARASSTSLIGPKWIAKGNVDGWIASLLDITEQKALEAELRCAEREARSRSRDAARWSATASGTSPRICSRFPISRVISSA